MYHPQVLFIGKPLESNGLESLFSVGDCGALKVLFKEQSEKKN